MAQFPLCTDDHLIILLEGEQLLITVLQEEINALISSVCTIDPPMYIDRPGLFQFLNTKHAKLAIKGIEASVPENIRTTNEVLKVQLRKGSELY